MRDHVFMLPDEPMKFGWLEEPIDLDDAELFNPCKLVTAAQTSLSFTLTDTSPEALNLFFGGSPFALPPRPAVSVVIDSLDTVSGAPARPTPPGPAPSWWRLRARHEWRCLVEDYHAALLAYDEAFVEWVDAGRPDKQVSVRTYIPRAVIE